MFQLFTDIQARINSEIGVGHDKDIKFFHLWNDQAKTIQEGGEIVFNMPAVFIEFAEVNPEQLGNGVQIFNPLLIKVHILHNQLDTASGTLDQNADIFTIRENIYKVLQMFKPAGAGSFIRTKEYPDYVHSNVYHWIQEYTTNYIDNAATPPKDPQNSPAPLELDLTVDNTP